MKNLIKDINFNLYQVLNSEKLLETERYKEHSKEIFDAVIDTAKRIAEDLFAPHNTKADENEPQFDGDSVKLIPETKKAWDAFAEAGFLATAMDEEWDGSQLPELIARAVYLIFCAANVSTSVYPFLTIGVAELIHSFASQKQKELYLPALLDGRFSGTMALTEPEQGSALADISTSAQLQADGSYLLKGQKIFISAGEHELSDNIIHLVLAKIEGAPAGVKGISLFICPKYLVNDDGSLGERNDLAVTGLLHKMGYRNASSTLLSFGDNDNCKAYLVGQAHKGLSYMFLMMNGARIGVGTGAAAIGYAGYSYSLNYAHERKQGRLPSNRDPSSPQLKIIKHADVRRMLLAQKSYVEGSLAVCLYATSLLDIQKTGTQVEKDNALALLEFLTPVVKSWPSKYGPKANDLAIQILAGAGYMRDHPVEQYYRDNRLNAIHEGTRGIQAIDLLGRKLAFNKFEYYQAFKDALRQTIKKSENNQEWAKELERALALHEKTSMTLLAQMAKDIDLALANASEYLEFTGKIVIAWQWLKMANAAQQALAQKPRNEQKNFYLGKLQAARYHFDWELPQIYAQAELLSSMNSVCFDMKEEWF